MYAIVEIAGQQFKVEEGKKIFVHRLEMEEGKKIDFDKVLLIDDNGSVTIGDPVVKGMVIEGKVLDHVRGDKVIVFKKKRKKGYRVKNGHRQNFTQVEIVSIGKSSSKKAKKEEEVVVEEHAEAREKKVSAKKSTAAEHPAEKPARKSAKKTE